MKHRHSVKPGGQRLRVVPGTWERLTNKAQRKLVAGFDTWSIKIRKSIEAAAKRGASTAEQYAIFEKGLAELEEKMTSATAETIRRAGRVSAKSRAALPAVEATITKHILDSEKIVKTGLIPTIHKRLAGDIARGFTDKKVLREAFLTVRNAPAQTAGSSWVTIFDVQRTLGRERQLELISEGKKPEKLRWVLDPAAEHCNDGPGTHGCLGLAREYDSWDALPTLPAGLTTCRGNCRCHLEVYRDGTWQRGVYPD